MVVTFKKAVQVLGLLSQGRFHVDTFRCSFSWTHIPVSVVFSGFVSFMIL